MCIRDRDRRLEIRRLLHDADHGKRLPRDLNRAVNGRCAIKERVDRLGIDQSYLAKSCIIFRDKPSAVGQTVPGHREEVFVHSVELTREGSILIIHAVCPATAAIGRRLLDAVQLVQLLADRCVDDANAIGDCVIREVWHIIPLHQLHVDHIRPCLLYTSFWGWLSIYFLIRVRSISCPPLFE